MKLLIVPSGYFGCGSQMRLVFVFVSISNVYLLYTLMSFTKRQKMTFKMFYIFEVISMKFDTHKH